VILHIHRDPNWQMHGANAYHQCKCGARKTVAMYANLASPTTPGWPHLVDRHGVGLRSSGWQSPPVEGWRDTSHLDLNPRPPRGGSGISA
jgi:hypothetical protein